MYVNAFSDDGEAVLVDRSAGYGERPLLERVPVYWSCFVRGPLERGILRTLKNAQTVKSVVVLKGGWLRVAFTGRPECKAGCEWLEERGVRTFEGNVDPVRRLLVERGIAPAKPRAVYLDLETDPRPGLANRTKMRVLIVGMMCAETGRKWARVLEEDTDESERKLLTEVCKDLEGYDQVIAWNSKGFDEPVLKARIKKLAVPVEPRRLIFTDHMLVYKKQNAMAAESGDEKDSYALDSVCAALKIPGKKEIDVLRMFEIWQAGGEELQRAVDYCLQDVALMPEIEKKTGYLELFWTLCSATGVFPNTQSIGPSHQVESFLLRLAKERGHRFATRFIDAEVDEQGNEIEEDEDKFRGAVVFKPSEAGIHKDVHVVDFARLYPSVILSLNLSPETKVSLPGDDEPDELEGFPLYLRNSPAWDRAIERAKEKERNRRRPEGCAESAHGKYFRQDPIGILSVALEEMLRLRKYWDDEKKRHPPGTEPWKEADRRSSAYKIAANSFYGVIGSQGSMFFDVDVAESTTLTGVALIQAVVDYAPKFGLRMMYGDTDSAFFVGDTERMREFVDSCNEEMIPPIITKLGGRNRIKLDYEKSFKRLVFSWNEKEKRPSSKMYCGKYAMFKGKAATADSKPEVKGLALKRGDSLRLTREMQRAVVDLLITKETDDAFAFDPLVEEWKKKIAEDKLDPKDVRISKQIAKSLEDYEQKPKKNPISLGAARVVKVFQNHFHVESTFADILVGRGRLTVFFDDIHEKCAFYVPDDGSRANAKSYVGAEGDLLLNDYGAGPAHVHAAKVLKANGTPVRVGDKVSYVVVDGSTSPKTIVPFDLWDGETVDRIDLWLQIWSASKRLLMGAFPGVDWSRHDVDYPKKERAKKERVAPPKRKGKVALGQATLSFLSEGETK